MTIEIDEADHPCGPIIVNAIYHHSIHVIKMFLKG